MAKKKKIILPPQLPVDIPEDEIQVSDEDLQFVKKNHKYTKFLKSLDTNSITKHVTRVAGQNEDALEALYEKRIKNKSLEKHTVEDGLEVDPVDALPVKTLDGQLYYRTASRESKKSENASKEDKGATKDKEDDLHESVVKLTKAEKRAKLKKVGK